MPLVVGERYRCPDADCGCEITVTRGAPGRCGDRNPTCCCGRTMVKLG